MIKPRRDLEIRQAIERILDRDPAFAVARHLFARTCAEAKAGDRKAAEKLPKVAATLIKMSRARFNHAPT